MGWLGTGQSQWGGHPRKDPAWIVSGRPGLSRGRIALELLVGRTLFRRPGSELRVQRDLFGLPCLHLRCGRTGSADRSYVRPKTRIGVDRASETSADRWRVARLAGQQNRLTADRWITGGAARRRRRAVRTPVGLCSVLRTRPPGAELRSLGLHRVPVPTRIAGGVGDGRSGDHQGRQRNKAYDRKDPCKQLAYLPLTWDRLKDDETLTTGNIYDERTLSIARCC